MPRVQFDGFKACFGGEELKRACATLSGALISGKLPVRRTQQQQPHVHSSSSHAYQETTLLQLSHILISSGSGAGLASAGR
jgi:hypothetical protein